MLRDFRSWPALTVPFQARIVVVAGENGAGKTNLLEAISLLGPGRGLRGARTAELGRAVRGRQPPLPWAAAGRFDGALGAGVRHRHRHARTAARPSAAIFRLDGAPLRSQAELAERVAAVWLTPQMDRLFQDGAGGRRRFLDRLVWALEPQPRPRGRRATTPPWPSATACWRRSGGRGWRDPPGWRRWRMPWRGTASPPPPPAAALVARLNATLAAGRHRRLPGRAAGPWSARVAAALDAAPALAVEDGLRADLAASRGRDAAAGGAAASAPHRADLLLTHAAEGPAGRARARPGSRRRCWSRWCWPMPR